MGEKGKTSEGTLIVEIIPYYGAFVRVIIFFD